MGKIYMIGSQKGGTAKTTTTFNLAYCLRKMGKMVLAVDFDALNKIAARWPAKVTHSDFSFS